MKKQSITIKKARKGQVGIVSRNGRLEFRWRPNGGKQRTKASGLIDTKINRLNCERVALDMEEDLAKGEFDSSLSKYGIAETGQEEVTCSESLGAQVFQHFIEYRQSQGTGQQTISSKYHPLKNRLKRFGEIFNLSDAQHFAKHLENDQVPVTIRGNLSILKSCSAWASEAGLLSSDILADLSLPKVSQAQKRRNDPFTEDEVQLFMETIASHPHYSHYRDFCYTLFTLGLRPSEAIGLQWKHIDFEKGRVAIDTSLARNDSGNSSGRARRRKETKTGSVRHLRMPDSLKQALYERKSADSSHSSLEDLIFLSPQGNPIDDRSFRRRCWTKICAAAGIRYRPPYASRHSFGKRLYEAGETPHTVAYAMGHSSPRTSLDAYGHSSYSPELPDPCDPT